MIKIQLLIFLVVGLLTVAIDFFIYRGLIYLGLGEENVSKGLGFIGGSIFSYFGNRYWTFKQQGERSGSVGKFLIVYIIGLSANIAINFLSLITLSYFTNSVNQQEAIILAFLIATIVSAGLNFLGMKFFVFTSNSISPPSFLI
ncbi:GtrA family protein [Polynucleobacter paneuropaeus]|nr:GtrA family protein [Polynucleobacter paneuropaeus]